MGLLGDILKGAGKAITSAIEYAKENPFQTALLAAGGYYLMAPTTAAAAPSIVGSGGIGASITGGTPLPGLGGAGFVNGAPVGPSLASQAVGGIGAIGKATGKFLTSPAGAAVTGAALQTGGAYMASKGASEDARQMAEERRAHEDEMYEKQQESRRISFTPTSRGILQAARSRAPIMASPSQALRMRRAGRI